MGYVDEVLDIVSKKNADQPEFLQAVTEVLDSLRPVIDANEELYRKNAILERITEPDRQIMFRVPWVDDKGQVQVNTGYRVQFNNAIGPYKGGIRLHPSDVDEFPAPHPRVADAPGEKWRYQRHSFLSPSAKYCHHQYPVGDHSGYGIQLPAFHDSPDL